MPRLAWQRRCGRFDCPTNWMISSFSAVEYLIRGRSHPRSCFFLQAKLDCLLGDDRLQCPGLLAQCLDLVAGTRLGRVISQAASTGFKELLRPGNTGSLRWLRGGIGRLCFPRRGALLGRCGSCPRRNGACVWHGEYRGQAFRLAPAWVGRRSSGSSLLSLGLR
jgi:hypothetical protein